MFLCAEPFPLRRNMRYPTSAIDQSIMTRKRPKSHKPERKASRPRAPDDRAATSRPTDTLRPRRAGERVAKVMARAGLCSRREAEAWIAAGRVAINGAVIASPAVNVTARDAVTVDGKPLPTRERTRLFLYHKPRGLVTTRSDPEGRPTIFGALPKDLPRLISVGRLDLNTEGLLLLTNDGGLARVLELPQTGWLRRYRVRAHGKVTQASLDALHDGITVDGVRYGPIEATLDREQGTNNWLTFAMREGKNREIRNVLGALGLQVNRLIRISFGPFQLGELADGAVEEVRTRTLREQIGERLAALASADFTAPLLAREAAAAKGAERGERAERWRDRARDGERAGRQGARRGQREERPAGHVWRDRKRGGEQRPAHQDRKTSGREDAARHAVIADRKGRSVVVERATDKPRPGRRPRGGKWRER
jgi:23S rRNA pseudouridine2605 synthase